MSRGPSSPAARTAVRGLSLLDVPLALAAAAAFLFLYVRRGTDGALVEVRDDEVAVVVDHWNRTERVVEIAGYLPTVPFFQQVYRLRRRAESYTMKGEAPEDVRTVERLLVRAKDGSSFWFGSFTIRYALIPGRAVTALHASEQLAARLEHGDEVDDDYLTTALSAGIERIHALARSILRDEFGRFSAEEAVQPQNLALATERAKQRLDALLEPSGVRVEQIATPKPQFDRRYESLIERRKVASQDAERLREKLARIDDEREYRLTKLRKELQILRETQRGELRRKVQQAHQLAVRTRSQADSFYSEKLAQAEAARSAMLQRAEALTERFDGEAASLREHVAAHALGGDAAVRAALVKRLGSIRFRIAPRPVRPSVGDDGRTALWGGGL